jgi:23S rRNA (uracil1939-C5)-methyltransferase
MLQAGLHVTTIAAGGDGIARSDGLAVFLPRTAPGDVVEAQLEMHGRYARGEVLAWQQRGPHRVDPPCVHYERDRCGGCQLQHLDLAAQHEAKRAFVHDAMQRIGHVVSAVPPLRPAPSPWRYRISLTLAMRRDGRGPGARWRCGLRDYADPEKVFDLEDCLITSPEVLRSWDEVRAAAEWLPNAQRLRATVRWLGDSAAFALVGGSAWSTARIAQFQRRVPSLAAARWTPERGSIRNLWDTRPEPRSPATSFTQVHPAVARELYTDVLDRVLRYQPRTVVDAYAGAGHVAVELHRAGVAVTAIEMDREAAAWSAGALAPPSRSLAGRVEVLLPRVLPADVVLLNPPRAGVDAVVTDALQRLMPRPRAIVYVSCNPATLARDVARLSGFRVRDMQPYDMFPQTAHVETVCEFVAAPEAA